MPATEMLDVLHYFFEDDVNYSTAEQAEAREKTRSSLYQELYNSTYKYTTGQGASGQPVDFDGDEVSEEEEEINPFTVKAAAKPYVAPTNFDPNAKTPFGKTLDAPMN